MQSALTKRSLLVTNDLVKTRCCDTQVLVVQPGNCTRNQLDQLQQTLSLQGTPVAYGCCWIPHRRRCEPVMATSPGRDRIHHWYGQIAHAAEWSRVKATAATERTGSSSANPMEP